MKRLCFILPAFYLFLSFNLNDKVYFNIAPNEISGIVFEDYNANGIRDTGEPGIGSIAVNGYADGDAVGTPSYTAITALDGTYALTGLSGGEQLRLEFILPAFMNYLAQGAAGNTSVVFASEGDENVEVGFNNPNNYSVANPVLITPCYVVGDHTDPTGGKRDVLVGALYAWGTDPTTNPDEEDRFPIPGIHYAQNEQIGTTYGVAWNRVSNTVYLAAYHKKHSDYGPNGAGAIYQMNIDPISGLALSAPSIFTDVASFPGISVCGAHGADLNPASDITTANQVGKCALGDLDISDDNTKLYTVNLGDRKIIEIDIATGNMTNSWQFPTILSGNTCFTCENTDDVRPFGLKFRNGLLYIGAMCTGENSGNNDHVRSFIYTINPSLGSGATFQEFYCFSWDTNIDNGDNNNWLTADILEVGVPGQSDNRLYMFSDIEFYGNDLILGFRDRNADMLGEDVPGVSRDGDGRGEIITAWLNTTTGQYELEAVSGANVSAGPNRPGSPQNYGEGPDDIEFYWGDGGYFHSNNPFGATGGATHPDQSFGGLAQVNTQDIVMTSLTPRQAFGVGQTGSGGFAWLNNVSGGPNKSYTLYDGAGNTPGDLFSKANGLGDIEGLTTPAPIEIGDYVWVDTDSDGVQDPGEAAISGVTVELYSGNNLVASTTTDGNGRYYFTSTENRVTNGNILMDAIDTEESTFTEGDPETNNFAHELTNGNMGVGADWRLNADRAWAGLRFPNLNIPQGATITHAYVQFTSNDAGLPESDAAEVRFYGEDENDINEYQNVDDGLSTRNRTSASIDWTIPSFAFEKVATANERSPDISTIIQEIVNRAGWTSGNALGLLMEYAINGNDGGRRIDADPRLVVQWTGPNIGGRNMENILPNTNYEVRLNLSQPQITSPSYNLTAINSAAAGGEMGNDAGSDIRDNDASPVSGNAVIAFSTGNWGENNHGLDFGFNSGPACTLMVSCSKTDLTNCTPFNGAISATVSGDQGNLTFNWENGSGTQVGTTASINNLPIGIYNLTVTDDILTGCEVTCTIEIIDNVGTPTVNCTVTDNTSCTIPNGSISSTATNVSYLWSTGATTPMLSNLSAGIYNLTVTDLTTGCTAECSEMIVDPVSPSCTVSVDTEPTCADLNGGAATANPNGGAAPYTYLWSDASGQTNQTATGLEGGMYTVTLTDANNCNTTCTITLDTPTGCCPTITNPSPTQTICEGQTVANLSIDTDATSNIEFVYFSMLQTGNAAYSGGTSLASVAPSSGMASISNVAFPSVGTFYVYARLSPAPADIACRPSEEIIVTVNPNPNITLAVSDPQICENNDAEIIISSSEVGVSYQLRLDSNDSPAASPVAGNGSDITIILSDLAVGSYTYNIVASNTSIGCNGELTDLANVTVNQCDFPTFPPPICVFPACHFISPEVYLGTTNTPDTDGSESTTTADDGIGFPNNIRRNIDIRLPITFYNNSGNPVYIQGWIDWDGDTNFATDEQVVNLMIPFDGVNLTQTISQIVSVPANALQDSPITARFRISSDSTIIGAPCGEVVCAADGEVEDYLIQIECPEEACLPIGITILRN